MSVKFRKLLQALTIVLPLAFVGGQMPATAASTDAPPTAPSAPAAPSAAAAPATPANPAAPAPSAQATPTVQEAPAPAPDTKPVDPQSQIVHSGSPEHPELGIPALDLKEDIREACAGDPILPFRIGTATTLRELLVKLHVMDTLTQVCAVENTVGQAIEKLTGPDGLLDLDQLLR
jgi:predicted lipid-binding transport protein (Tim44 family)